MAKPVILTDEGLKKYEDELEMLKTVKRKEISEKIEVALSFLAICRKTASTTRRKTTRPR